MERGRVVREIRERGKSKRKGKEKGKEKGKRIEAPRGAEYL
jgi:hypothetical protein